MSLVSEYAQLATYFISVRRKEPLQWVSDKYEFVKCIQVFELLFFRIVIQISVAVRSLLPMWRTDIFPFHLSKSIRLN